MTKRAPAAQCCLTCGGLWYRPNYALRHACRWWAAAPLWPQATARPREDVGCTEWQRREKGADATAVPELPKLRKTQR